MNIFGLGITCDFNFHRCILYTVFRIFATIEQRDYTYQNKKYTVFISLKS